MSWPARIYGRISPHLSNRPGASRTTALHAKLITKTGGRFGTRFFGGSRLLVLRTVGRKSGQVRETPLIFVELHGGYAVAASNAAASRAPAWWLNLQARPRTEAMIRGRWLPVQARRADADEERRAWKLMADDYEGVERYREIATREMPIVILEPVDG